MKASIKISILLLTILNLFITLPLFAKEYKGAEYRTKLSYTYGRFEVRMKSSFREGMLSSFFTYYDGGGGVSNWNEIDIEIMGRYPDDIQFNTITPGQTNHVGHVSMLASPHSDYHVYAFEWAPEYVSWFIDGIEVLKQTGAHIQTLNKAQKIMMNIWNPQFANWAGTWNPDILPVFAFYDWVSYYSYTPDSGNYGTENNFTHSWTDNFDYWNTARWDKASHTWDGNGCDFIYENVVFQDGKLILCLTTSTNIGYTDVKGPALLATRVVSGKVVAYFSEELDVSTSQNPSNYIIVGATVNDALLLNDQKSVQLTVDGWDFNSAKNLLVMNVKDRFITQNTMNVKVVSIILPQPLTFPLKINCAGSVALGYLADQEWNFNSEYGYMDGSVTTYASNLQINGTDEDEIYRSEKFGMVTYKIRLTNGVYNVKLMFAENYFNSSGNRIFDVYLEHNRIIENLDIYNLVGKNAAYVSEIQNVEISDEVLDIYFAAKVDNALINGIVITPNSTGSIDKGNISNIDFKVAQNYPNPFNGKTVINYSLSSPDNLRLELFNILGEQIFFEDLGFVSAGSHNYILDVSLTGSHVTSGVYFLVFSGTKIRESRKLVLLN